VSKKPNIGLLIECEVFGVKANAALCRANSGIVAAGELNPQGNSLGGFVSKAIPINDLCKSGAILNECNSNSQFTAKFAMIGKEKIAVLAKSGALALCFIKNDKNWQAAFAMSTAKLKNSSNAFEKDMAVFAEWAGIENLNIIVQNSKQSKEVQLLKLIKGNDIFLDVPENFQSNQLIIGSKFKLEKNGFGKFLKELIQINELDLWIGATPQTGSFGVSLVCGKIDTKLCAIENLTFALSKDSSTFFCAAGGVFTLKLDSGNIKFMLAGSASNTSFMLTGASFPETKFKLTEKLFFSDLALSIGISNGVAFGMTGRITTDKLSIFAGFMISVPPPKINLLTAAITTTKGSLSLADIVSDIAEIQFDAVKFLDVIAIEDFELQANIGKNKFAVNTFNSAVGNEFAISDYKITELGRDQYIVTDNVNMRHFRIDANGKVSLNCQIYTCFVSTKIGTNTFNPGFFICGVLKIFGVKARFLFKAEKGVSLIALVQISPVKIKAGSFTLFELSGSKKDFPIAPIDGGAAGKLVKAPEKGKDLVLYINVKKTEVSCYLSAYLNVLEILKFDALVIIRDKNVYIDASLSYWGFSIIINIATSYQSFSSANFEFSIKFDTSGFLKMLQEVQETLRNAAKKVSNTIEEAQRKLTDAQNSVLRLQNEIDSCNRSISNCKRAINNARWYQVVTKTAKALEIAWLEVKKVGIYVAIGVAYAALEAAKAVLGAAGKIATSVLKAAATIIQYATQLLWIKSFEFGVKANGGGCTVKSKLVLIVLGKEKIIEGNINLGDPSSFVKNSLKSNSDEIVAKAEKGETIHKAAEIEFVLDDDILEQCKDLNKNYQRFEQSVDFTNALDEFFIGAAINYMDVYGEENPNFREVAGNFANMRMECEMNAIQNEMSFNEEFASSVDVVVDALDNETSRSFSPDFLNKMKGLKKYANNAVQMHRSGHAGAFQRKAKRNLMDIYSNEIEKSMEVHRNKASVDDIPIEESNEKYADSLVALLEKNFGDLDKDSPMNLMNNEYLATAIYELRNMQGRTKVENTNSEDDDELL